MSRSKNETEVKMKGTMRLKTAVYTSKIRNCIFQWIISDYTMLKPGRLYCQMFMGNNLKCSYKLLNVKRRLFIGFLCEYSNAHGMFYLTNGRFCKKFIHAFEIADGLYIGNFSEFLIMQEDGAYQNNEPFVVGFRFLKDCSISVQLNTVGRIEAACDYDNLCHNIQDLYLYSTDSDFSIKVGNISLKAHKCILYARSKVFQEYLEKDKYSTEIAIPDIAPGIMSEVLLYIYSGELCDINAKCMAKVLEAAYLLNILSLKEKCINYFEETDSWEVIETVEFFVYEIEDER